MKKVVPTRAQYQAILGRLLPQVGSNIKCGACNDCTSRCRCK